MSVIKYSKINSLLSDGSLVQDETERLGVYMWCTQKGRGGLRLIPQYTEFPWSVTNLHNNYYDTNIDIYIYI